jgi:hypothetical protein
MKIYIAAALALTAASSLHAQAPAPAQPTPDFSTAVPIDGTWNYAPIPAGSEATFVNTAALPQLTIGCARATRQVTISRPASVAAAFISVWTTAQTRSLPASFNPATGRLTATLSAYDPFLDAIAFSRGRIAVSVTGQPALILPAWADAARVVEDCRV